MFSLKGLLPDTKHTVGLDIGSSAVKLVEILDVSEGYLLNNFSQIPLERGVIVEGAIVDGDILCEKIRRLFKTAGCRAKKVVVSLSGHKVIARKAVFQTMEEEDLRQLINDEAGNYLPFDDVKDVSFDFQILGESEGNPGQMDVLLVAAKKNIVQSYVDILEKAGLKPVIMDVDSFALETMYEVNYESENGDVVVLVNIGASMTNINVLKGQGSIFTRDISMGGQHLTDSIQEKLCVTFDEAERIKLESVKSDVQSPGSLRVDPLDHAEPLFAEIERSIDYFRSTHGGEYIKEVILSGGSAKIKGIGDALTQRLNIETQIVSPFHNIAYHKKFDSVYIEDIGPVAALGIGLALRRMDDR